MDGKQHLELGMLVGFSNTILINTYDKNINILNNNKYIGASILIIGGTILGSLFPDIDRNTSMLGRRLGFFSGYLNKKYGHRFFIHSLPFYYILFSIPLLFFHNFYLNIFLKSMLIGILFHLFQDTFTKGRVPLLYPFSDYKFGLGIIKSYNIDYKNGKNNRDLIKKKKASGILAMLINIIIFFSYAYCIYNFQDIFYNYFMKNLYVIIK